MITRLTDGLLALAIVLMVLWFGMRSQTMTYDPYAQGLIPFSPEGASWMIKTYLPEDLETANRHIDAFLNDIAGKPLTDGYGKAR